MYLWWYVEYQCVDCVEQCGCDGYCVNCVDMFIVEEQYWEQECELWFDDEQVSVYVGGDWMLFELFQCVGGVCQGQ